MPEPNVSRRDFLKIMGLAGTLTAAGCQDRMNHLIPYINPFADIPPGENTWFATTCRQCPAGCGMLAKNLDGRVIKLEGNPLHPVNSGRLCPRGQAALHKLYNPDRHPGPLVKSGARYKPISWPKAEQMLARRIKELSDRGEGHRIVILTDLVNGTLAEFIGYFLDQTGGGTHIAYDPYAYEALRTANQMVYGYGHIPAYNIAEADFLISFGAGFLETWISNVEYAHAFSRFHEPVGENKNLFVWVGPRHSLTGANADHQVVVPPGREYAVAAGLLNYLAEADKLPGASQSDRDRIKTLTADFSLEAVEKHTGADKAGLRQIAEAFSRAKKPLVLAGGLPVSDPNALETAVAANLLCRSHSGTEGLIDFSRVHAVSHAATAEKMKDLAERMQGGEVALLMVHDANPVFTLPQAFDFEAALAKVPMVVSFSSCADETTRRANLVLPASTPLETWMDYAPKTGVVGLIQPTMGALHDTKDLGDILLAAGRRCRGKDAFAATSFLQVMEASWRQLHQNEDSDLDFERFWLRVRQQGGIWGPAEQNFRQMESAGLGDFAFPPVPSGEPEARGPFSLAVYPTIQFYDGRMANHSVDPGISGPPHPDHLGGMGGNQHRGRKGLKRGNRRHHRNPVP